jgi:hypothetical protein
LTWKPVLPVLERPLDLAPGLARLQRLPLVVHLLALGQGDLHLDAAVLQVDPGGHQGQALFLDLAHQAADLALVQEQLPGPHRLVVEQVAVGVGVDVAAHQERLLVPDADHALLDVHLALADGLDLGAQQGDPGLEGLQDVVIVEGLLVGGEAFGFQHGRLQRRGRKAAIIAEPWPVPAAPPAVPKA